jgi:hypothetical protein
MPRLRAPPALGRGGGRQTTLFSTTGLGIRAPGAASTSSSPGPSISVVGSAATESGAGAASTVVEKDAQRERRTMTERIIERAAEKISSQATAYSVGTKLRLIPSLSYVVLELAIRRHEQHVTYNLSELKPKRRKYSHNDKQSIINAATETNVPHVLASLKRKPGYEQVSRGQITRWQRQGPARKRGRKGVSDDFIQAVLAELIYARIERVHERKELIVIANIAYTNSIIREAALRIQRSAAFSMDAKVKVLSFSDPWIVQFKKKAQLVRRRATTTEKKLPPTVEIRKHMAAVQEVLKTFAVCQRKNADETGILYGEKPKHQYVPEGTPRGSAPDCDDKARFTCMLSGGADGEMDPDFSIIKCTSKAADLSKTRVIKNLHASPGFTSADGWSMHLWEREIEVTNTNKQLEKRRFKRPYLKHIDGSQAQSSSIRR